MRRGDNVIMKHGIRYIVTKMSYDKTLEIGDHISVNSDGSINCIEMQGWISIEDVPEATKGMEVVVDKEWIERMKRKLQEKLEALEEI